jgi:hypothetical protein
MSDRINGFLVNCIGGLNTNRDLLSQGEREPGSAFSLINYEPSINGGYRRISGYSNDYGIVPGVDKVLGVEVCDNINDNIFACRAPGETEGDDYFYRWDNTTSTWIAVTTPDTISMTGVKKVRFTDFNWGAQKICLTDGVNPAAIYNGTTYTQITSALAPDAPKYSAPFKNHLFLAGDPSEPFNLYFSAPYAETDFTPANGAGVINVGFEIVQIKGFRDSLFIFGKNAIKKLEGASIANFVLSEVTTNLGCIVPDSVVEIGGDLVFLSSDGFRPVAGTSRIGDVQLETISKRVQFTINAIFQDVISQDIDPETLTSVVIRKKSQFRMFLPEEGLFGMLGGLRETDGNFAYEFSQLFNIPATCAASAYVGIDEVVIHGDASGKVHRQESGTSFDGEEILSVYQTPYYYFQDPTVRKNFYNVTTFLRSEGVANIVMSVSYDFEDSVGVFNPSNYDITTAGAASYYNEAVYDSTSIYDGNPSPVRKTNISGSGFSVAFKYVTNDTNASHTIQGLVMNYSMNDRR